MFSFDICSLVFTSVPRFSNTQENIGILDGEAGEIISRSSLPEPTSAIVFISTFNFDVKYCIDVSGMLQGT